MQCVVLAGGLATRMRPLTEKVPKVLLEVEGRPFLHYALRLMAAQGVTEAVLALGHLAEQVEAYLAAHPAPIRVRIVREREPLGTAGALRLCLDAGVLDDRFLLTWGDSFLPVDWKPVWEAFTGDALMTVLENNSAWDKSNVRFRDGRLLYDKAAPAPDFTFIDYGLMGLTRAKVAQLPPGKGDLAHAFRDWSAAGEVQGFVVKHRFYEIGSPRGLEDFAAFVRAPVLAVLDRDGVLNQTVAHPHEPADSPMGPEEVALVPGAAEAVRTLAAHGVAIAIASNQPAAAKGKTTVERLDAAHAQIVQLLGAPGITSHLCRHKKEDGCACRKPKPKLLLDARAAHPGHDDAWMVGDRATDAEAGRAAGMRTALVAGSDGDADWKGPDLAAFVRFLGALKGW